MAQFIRTPFDVDNGFDAIRQISQITYHNERIIEILFDDNANRVLVQNNGEWFYLRSPDIENLTIHHILMALDCGNEQAIVTWPENEHNDYILNTPIHQVELNQISLYAPNQPIPQFHNPGPFPAIAGQPVDRPINNVQNYQDDVINDNNNDNNNDDVYDDDDANTYTYPSTESDMDIE
jgi:hypothetical protein